ncbi:MAG: diacylglycerol/lipid kinase family protein, partial [Planctomycetota bacterium]
MRYHLVCNPGSAGGRGRRTLEVYRRLLARRGADFTWRTTADLDDASRLAREANGADAVVAVGGDGTINRVLSGLVGRRASLGVLYSGTSPDFCRFHGLPTDPER